MGGERDAMTEQHFQVSMLPMLPRSRNVHDGRKMCNGRRLRQRGVSGVMVIAVLVLLGGLTAFAVGLVTSVQSSYARELSFARAMQAAEAGLDWGRWRVTAVAVPACSASQTLVTLPGTLLPYAVTVRCTLSGTYLEGPATVRMYRLDSTACNLPAGGQCPNSLASSDYVQATASAIVER